MLHRAIAPGLRQCQLVRILVAHQAKILRQDCQLGTTVRRLLQQPKGLRTVALPLRAGHHLEGGYFHGCILYLEPYYPHALRLMATALQHSFRARVPAASA